MPKLSEYSRRQFISLQIAMCVILAGSVGVAALVGNFRRTHAARIELGDPVQLKTVTVRFPAGWIVSVSDSSPDSLFAIESKSPPWQRRIMATERDANSGNLFDRWLGNRSRVLAGPSEKIQLGPATGELRILKEPADNSDERESSLSRVSIRAEGKLPNGQIISLQLFSLSPDSRDTADDVNWIKAIAASIRVMSDRASDPV